MGRRVHPLAVALTIRRDTTGSGTRATRPIPAGKFEGAMRVRGYFNALVAPHIVWGDSKGRGRV
jgi:hypothetical protein